MSHQPKVVQKGQAEVIEPFPQNAAGTLIIVRIFWHVAIFDFPRVDSKAAAAA
jgi:hypothetical protein